jgi:hypothetical protein
MLLRVLHDEARALGVRVQLLAVEKPARTGREGEHACAHWPSAVAIGRRALELVDQVDTREPAAAVVRYAPNEFPPLPGQTVEPSRVAPSGPRASASDVQAVPSRPRASALGAAPAPATPRTSALAAPPAPGLDDTWAMLKPLLTSESK